MATPLDSSQFEVVSPAAGPAAAPAQPQQQPAAPAAQPLSSAQFEELPSYADGSSPKTPINSSPLSMQERFQLALGDDKGKQDFLKQRFSAVTKDADGNQVVQDKQTGLWHRTDASAFKDVDAWTATKGIIRTVGALGVLGFDPQAAEAMANKNPVSKELMGDYADILPKAAVGGIATVATGGGSLVAQAAGAGTAALISRGAVTSLGRLEGTYQASAEDQMKDAAYEGLLNAGGVYIGAGVKAGAGKIADMLPDFAKNFSLMPQSSKDAFKSLFGGLALGDGAATHIDEVLENTDGVKQMMKMGAAASGGSDGYKRAIFQDQIATVREANETGKQMLRGLYGKLEDQLVNAVPANFSGDVGEVVKAPLQALADKGLVEMEVAGQRVSAAEAAEMMAQGKSIAQDAKWVMKGKADLLKQFQRGNLDVADAALNDDTHAALSQVVDTFNNLSKAKANGADGVRMLMKSQQAVNDLTYQLAQTAKEGSNNAIPRLMADINKHVTDGFTSQFEKVGAGQAFTSINSSYAAMKQPMSDLMNAVARADRTGSDQALESFIKRISAKATGQAQKNSFSAISETADKYGLTALADKFDSHAARLRAGDAAVAFNPWVKPGSMTAGTAAFAASAAMTGHVLPAMGAAGALVASSPRVVLNSTLAAKSLMAGKQQLAILGKDGVQALAANPQAMQLFTRAVMGTPVVANAVQQHLLQPVQQMMGGGGGQQQ